MLVPARLPKMVATESVKRMRLSFGMRPSSSISPARRVTPTRVPILSNRSTNRKTNRISNRPRPWLPDRPSTPARSSWKAVCADRGQVVGLGREADRRRAIHPASVVAAMPIRIAPRTFHAASAAVTTSPNKASAAPGACRSPSVTEVAGLVTTIPAFLRPIKRDEQADPARHRGEQMRRDRGDDQLADAGEGQQQEGDARDEDAAQRHRPGHAHRLDDGEAEIGVEPHARRQRERHVGGEAHQDAGEARGEAGGRRDRRDRHAGLAEDRRIDQHDIGHGQEGGDAREDLGAQGAAARAELETPFEQADSLRFGQSARPPFAPGE